MISYLGDWFNTIAIYTSVQAMTDSAQAVAAVMIAKTLPIFLMSPVAGPLIDRFDRRRLLIISDLVRALCVLGLVASHELQSLIGLYSCTTLMVIFSGIVLPARNAVLPMIVKQEHIPIANALGGGTWSIMLALGAALGGVATAWLGVSASFLVDGLTFVAAALFFARLPALKPSSEKKPKEETSFTEGVRYLFRDRYVLTLAMLKPMQAMMVGAVALVPMFGNHFAEAGGSAALFIGILYTSRGLGALTGSMVVRIFIGDKPKTLARSILVGFLLVGGGFYFSSISTTLTGVAFGYFIAAIGGGLNWVYSGTLLQLEADKAFHGRVFAIEFGLLTLFISASSWVLSYLVDQGRTLYETLQLASMVVILPLTVWSLTLLLRKR